MRKWKNAKNRKPFELRKISLVEVTNILKEMKNTTTMGHDTLDALSLKLVATTISEPILHILNLSIETQTFCMKWKLGKLLPLFKGGDEDKMNMKAYRPISILPIISKIMERSIQSQVLEYMNETGQFNQNLHAYRSLHSTTTAAMQLTDFTAEAADHHMIANAMLIDQSSAFDCVNAEILDQKLKLYCFSDNSRKWFRSYMNSRSQFVSVGAAVSNFRPVTSGVPQGSVLGPILYLLYTNELPETVKEKNCQDHCHEDNDDLFGPNCYKCGILPTFADDSTVIVARKTQNENKIALKEKLNNISDFLQNNDLCINQAKTKTIDFMMRQKRSKIPHSPITLEIQTENELKIIKNQVHVRFLGLNLQSDLSWRAHLETGYKPLLQTLRKRLGALCHLGKSYQ